MSYFFLSYARSDDTAEVDRFYQDLCAEIRMRAGVGGENEDVGFVDRSGIGLGQDWSDRITRELFEIKER